MKSKSIFSSVIKIVYKVNPFTLKTPHIFDCFISKMSKTFMLYKNSKNKINRDFRFFLDYDALWRNPKQPIKQREEINFFLQGKKIKMLVNQATAILVNKTRELLLRRKGKILGIDYNKIT